MHRGLKDVLDQRCRKWSWVANFKWWRQRNLTGIINNDKAEENQEYLGVAGDNTKKGAQTTLIHIQPISHGATGSVERTKSSVGKHKKDVVMVNFFLMEEEA